MVRPEMAGPEMGYTRNSEQIYKCQLGILGSTFTHILEFHKCKKYETKIGFGTLLSYLNDLSGGMGKSAEFVAKYSKVHIAEELSKLNANSFELITWICSTLDYNVPRILMQTTTTTLCRINKHICRE